MSKHLRVLLLADSYSEHTEKWALGLAANGVEVGIFSFNKASYPWHSNQTGITILFEPKSQLDATNSTKKITYLRHVKFLKKVISEFKPDVLHAHYATSYGLVGALTKFHPFVISAWGTDVMKFPQKNFINKLILKFNLKKADALCATSYTIKDYLVPITDKPVNVIPFGININTFKLKQVKSIFETGNFVFGTVKSLEKLYNIDVSLKAFSKLRSRYPERKMKFLIVGEGSQVKALKQLTIDLKIEEDIFFTGRISFSEIADYYNMLDVLLNISEYESFGVSVIEAMACEKPVIVTNTGGLKEIVENSNYGSLVEIGNVDQTSLEMEKYLLDADLVKRIGSQGRQKVISKYNWADNILQMIDVYHKITDK